jgi:uncharacterized membrane protein HdeD (DUF308 family)
VTAEGLGGHPQGLASSHVRVRFARALSRLYFTRTAVSLIWVLTVSAVAGSVSSATSPGALIESLLFLYPITDAAATLVDICTTPPESQTLFQRVNLVTSVLTAGAVLAVHHRGFGATLQVFGTWAILSGVVQLIVALRRHTLISAQWFMVISGAGSIFAGTTFLRWSGTAHEGLAVLVQYSTGGAIWYAVAAAWLLASVYKTPQAA